MFLQIIAKWKELTYFLYNLSRNVLFGKPFLKLGILCEHHMYGIRRKYLKYQEEREKREESDQQEFGLF
jgi:hypothetical protein